MSSSLLIKNATVISVDDTIGIQMNSDILVQDGLIKDIGPNLISRHNGEVFDATDCIVSPGFVDTHHHMWQQLIRGVTTDWSLANYLDNIRNIYGSLYTPDDVYTANHFAALDLINNGITTVIDHCHILNSSKHTDAAIKGLKDAGIRGTWCYGFYRNPGRSDLPGFDPDITTPAGFDHQARRQDAKRAREEHFPENNPEKQLLTFGGAPTEAEGMTEEALRDEIDFFRSIGARVVTMHVAIGNYAASSFTDSELDLIKNTGSGISATPETELQMGMGHPIAFRAAEVGCHVGLGIDITSNQSNDMLALMRLLLQAERGKRHRENPGTVPIDIQPKSEEALYMATMGGAKSIGLDHIIGSITPGKRADLVITRCDDMNVVPVTKPVGALMYNAHVGNIDTVLINGKIVKKDGKVVGVDWPKLREDVRTRTARMLDIAAKAPPPSEDSWTRLLVDP
ncbi:hypothetical protein LTR10_020380 [Elasticomyces elasticus]|uniref:Amidohydrolase-related domain-containing protein n=1 Tax=Exophiala sideris TaxID=1016849 RepID=A0ABR0JMU8_9EURO|nr:hypothetical protein LTR10_020380 [Elasticomyces elasticus]KAK5036380.1 hypothetical protein LTS07_002107 [Exophiala sideris]KAK5066764.1 hypothetical protein LTR69_002111 [Exophiala sideris]KAK5184822.1 hypothetical protein LTR44_002668 [Eurotiomycetes sp. CCFEE 6388]